MPTPAPAESAPLIPSPDYNASTLDWALAYRRLGLWPHPIRAPRAGDEDTGKAPVLSRWQTMRIDEASLPGHFRDATRNVGVNCGPSRVVILDFDEADAFAPWAAAHPDAARSFTTGRDNSPPGRCHVWFKVPDGEPVPANLTHAKVGWGCLLSDGKQAVAPPSRHYSGGQYVIRVNAPILPWRPEYTPEPWGEAATATPPRAPKPPPAPRPEYGPGIPPSVRQWLGTGAPQGSRSAVGFQIATQLRDEGHNQAAAETLVLRFAARCSPPWPDAEARATVRSAFSRPPRDPARDPTRTAGTHGGNAHAGPAGTEPGEWPDPEPLPDGLPAVPAFTPDLLPVAFRAFAADVSHRMQAPLDFAAVGLMTVAGSIVGGRVGIRPRRHDDWTEFANLWGAVIAPPSSLKSPALAEPMAFLHRLEVAARESYEQELAGYETAAEAHKLTLAARRDVAKVAAKSALKEGTDPASAARDALGQAADLPPPPVRRRYLTNDGTVEKLGELLRDNATGFLNFRDELTGWLRAFDRDGHEQDRAFFIEAFTGKHPFTVDRIGRGTIEVPRLILSVLGGIQPGPFAAYLAAAARGGVADDGLVQRFQLAVWPDVPRDFAPVDRYPDTPAKQIAWGAIERLATVTPEALDAETDGSQYFLRFDPKAQLAFTEWHTGIMVRTRSGELPGPLANHLGKYPKTMPTLALLFHLIDGGRGPIPHACAARAIAWMKYLEGHARRIYHHALHPDHAAACALGRQLARGALADGFTLRDVHRHGWADLTDRDAVEAGANLLVDLGWIRPLPSASSPVGGRPTYRYAINPKIGTHAGNRTDETDKTPSGGGSVSFGGALPYDSRKFEAPGAGEEGEL